VNTDLAMVDAIDEAVSSKTTRIQSRVRIDPNRAKERSPAMWTFGNLARSHSYSPYSYGSNLRADGDTPSRGRKEAMMDAGIYKATAVVTAGLVGGISAYKGLPEIKNFAGLDVIAGVLLSGAEFYMLWKGKSGKTVAAVGGVSTGLLCHWAAVQGTIWGVNKAKSEGLTPGPEVKGFDYDAHEPQALPQVGRVPAPAQAQAGSFNPYYGSL
jgi:hypothetical protein